MELSILKKIGLTDSEIGLYQILLDSGELTAGEIIKKSNLKRGDCYNKLYSLERRGLISEVERKGKKIFRPEHPDRIQGQLDKQYKDLVETKNVIESIMPTIKSQYNMVRGKPQVKFYEGVEGIKEIYDRILQDVPENGSFDLVRAKYEKVYDEQIVPNVLMPFVRKRAKKGIKVNALAPYEETFWDKDKEVIAQDDAKIGYLRQWVDVEDYDAPVEIDIYDDKVAILSFKNELIGIEIESPQIAQALKQIYALARIGARVKFKDEGKIKQP